MVDLVDAAVLVSGLDAWSFHPAKGYESIDDEPRLRDAIARRFQAVGLKLSTEEVGERAKALERAYRSWTLGSQQTNPPSFPGVRFFLLHSLSHLLMSASSLECGYSASALKERLYCAPRNDAVPMAAILITRGPRAARGRWAAWWSRGGGCAVT